MAASSLTCAARVMLRSSRALASVRSSAPQAGAIVARGARAGTAAAASATIHTHTHSQSLLLTSSRLHAIAGRGRTHAGGQRSSSVARFATAPTTPEVGGADEASNSNDLVGEETGSVDSIRVFKLEGADVGALSDVLLSLGATCCSVEDADLGGGLYSC
jgi:hypothetical protein